MSGGALPEHGRIDCRLCWQGRGEEKEFVSDDKRFKLVNDPAAWGSATPRILVLGMTKGNTQSDAMNHGDFDAVAFKNMRPNLLKVLQSVGLARDEHSVDRLIKPEEREFGWGSVVRCSLTGWDEEKDDFSAESGKVLPALKDRQMRPVFETCTARFLSDLPESVRLVVFLGNADGYMKIVQQRIRQLYPRDFIKPDGYGDIAYQAGGKWWVHVGHPSKGNGYLNRFLTASAEAGQGKKRELAQTVVNGAVSSMGITSG